MNAGPLKRAALPTRMLAFSGIVMASGATASMVFFPNYALEYWPSVAAIIPLSALFVLLAALRSWVILDGKVSLLDAVLVNGLSLTLSSFLPAKSGELAKPLALRRMSGLNIYSGSSLVVVERVLDGLAVATLALFGGVRAAELLPIRSPWLVAAVLAAGVGFCLAAWLSFPRIRRIVRTAIIELRSHRWSLGRVAWQLLLTLAIWGISFSMVFTFALLSDSIQLGIGQLFSVFVGSTLALVVAVTPGGWGFLEGATVGLLVLYGVGVGDALAFALALRIALFIVPFTVALIAAASLHWRQASRVDG